MDAVTNMFAYLQTELKVRALAEVPTEFRLCSLSLSRTSTATSLKVNWRSTGDQLNTHSFYSVEFFNCVILLPQK